MRVFEQIEERGHEQVVFCSDKDSGLKAIIAIHDTTLGPALGGLRMWPYKNDDDALDDVLRLSHGMTYKAAIAGLNLGGGKAVIIGDPRKDKSEALFRSFGRFIEGLAGRYITAEDVGTSVADMEWIRQETKYVTGIQSRGGSGDPSPFTAYGVYHGIKAACKHRFGSDSIEGKTVAVQGAGSVGGYLIEHLCNEGAKVVVTDIYEERVKVLMDRLENVSAVEPDEIYDVECDVFSPAALGGSINDQTIDRIKASIIAGAANNQLRDELRHAQALKERDILYVPDYVINAGGLINVYVELEGYSEDRALHMAGNIYDIVLQIIELAEANSILTVVASNHLAEERIAQLGAIHSRYVGVSRRKEF
jgi:leucine dehydrogenase